MPKESQNTKDTHEYIIMLSKLTSLPEDVVATVLEGQSLCMQHRIYEKGMEDRENGIRETFSIEVPYIGTLRVTPKKYESRDNYEVQMDGGVIKTSFTPLEKFLWISRQSYFGEQDPLIEHALKKYEGIILDKYKNLL